ncbi:MAG: cadherin-like domain-containing protein, partial [Colwellia sp.]|nr:cadherin-like domain-containing protein [Colwellia sp.]
MLFIITCFSTLSFAANNDNSLIDEAGDIAFTAYYTPAAFGTTGFAFLLLDDCPAGGSITFIDDEWDGASFSSGEGVLTWSSAAGTAKGTLVTVSNVGATPAVDVGTIVETVAGFSLSNGDGLYAVAGTRASPTAFLSFVGTGQNFSGTSLVDGTNAHVTSIRGYYNGTSIFNGTAAAASAAINSATWVGTAGFTFPADIVGPYSGSLFAAGSPPTVTTTAASLIGGTTATLGGNATADGGAAITERGVVYAVSALNADPEVGGANVTKVANASGLGVFSAPISGLLPNTAYSFKSYATNSQGTSYGTVDTFATLVPPTITFADISKTYGDANFNLGATTNSGGAISYSIEGVNTTGTTLSGTDNITVNLANAGTVTIRATVTANGIYSSGTKDITLTINKATLTATADNKSRAYGDANPVLTISYSGFKNSETTAVLTVESTGSSIATTTTNVGTVDIDVSGGVDDNYAFQNVKGTLTIGKATLTATADNKVRVYGDANPALTISYSGFKNGDTSAAITEPTASTTATVTTNVGTVLITLSGGSGTNYTINIVNGTLTIGKQTLTVTADDENKIYGYSNPSFKISYSGFRNSETTAVLTVVPTASSIATKTTNVGNVDIDVAGGLDNNYDFLYVKGTLTIEKATLEVTAGNKSKTYGDANPSFTISYLGFLNSETSAVLTSVPTTSSIATTTTNVGNVDIDVAGGLVDNYDFLYVKGTLTIGKATLTATADDKAKSYGDANPVLTISYSGFKNSETSAVLTVEPSASSIATPTTNVGTVDIDVAGGLDNNYDFLYVKGTLTIGKATLTVTADNKSRAYGDANPAFTISYSGFKNSETTAVLTTEPSASSIATPTTNAGTVDIDVAAGSDDNYSFSYTAGALTITGISISISANAQSKIVGDADPALTYQLTSGALESGDTFTGSLSRSAGESAGSYIIDQGSVQADAKYVITYIQATFTISPKPVNHAPVISGSPATTVAEGAAYRFSPTVTDSDAGDSKRFSITNKPTWALFNTASGALTGTPTDNDIGNTSGIVISVRDSGNASASLSAFNVEVTSTNTLPVATSKSVNVQEDSEVSITLEASDADNDELTFVVTQQPTHGSLSLSSTSDATWRYKADKDYNGSDEFSYQVKDKEGSSEPAIVSINITPVNDKPLAEDDNVVLNFNEEGSYTIDVLVNDSDVDGDTLSIVSASVNIGSVKVENNQLVYQLNGAIQGGIQLSYLIDDGSGTENSSAKASVSLLIEGDVNTQLPIITLPADIEVNAKALFTKIDLGVATAIDKNGAIVPVFLVDSISMFKPGNNLAYWKAVDEDGLEQTATQKVKVQPLITIGKDAVGAEGQHYSVGVYLNGTAPDYPVIIPYTVSGSADENDHLLTSGELVITQGVEGVIDIETLVDDIDEDAETLIITLTGGKNLGTKSSFTLTLIEGNITPELSYRVTQNDEQRLLIEANSADVIIQSTVI